MATLQKIPSRQEQELQDDLDLLSLQDLRRTGIASLTPDGKLPKDTDDRIMLLSLSDGLERQIMTRKKMNKEEADSHALAKARAEATLLAIQNRKPVKELTGFHTEPDLPDTDILSDLVPGETDLTTERLNYEMFIQRMEAEDSEN